jgi:hypothetical protein
MIPPDAGECPGTLSHPSFTCAPWAQNIPGFSFAITDWSPTEVSTARSTMILIT